MVADHLDYIGRSLHHHHTAEDELAWPLLLERVPDELAPIVELMESQHERVDGLLGEIAEVTPAWRASASAVDRDRLADLTDTLYAHVAEHLDAEEERLLPIAARTLTEEEWKAIGLRAKNSSPRADLTLTFGMFQYEGDPAVLARMLARRPRTRALAGAAPGQAGLPPARPPDPRHRHPLIRHAGGPTDDPPGLGRNRAGRPGPRRSWPPTAAGRAASWAARASVRWSRAASRSPDAAARSPSTWCALPRKNTGSEPTTKRSANGVRSARRSATAWRIPEGRPGVAPAPR